DANENGSKLRQQEESDARNGRQQAYWIKTDPWAALTARIEEKVNLAKNYDHSKYEELWLLISSNIPKLGAAASTTVSPMALHNAIDELNSRYGAILAASPYEMVHWYLHMTQDQTLFTWSRTEEKWSKSTLPLPPQNYMANFSFDEMKAIWNDSEWRRDPKTKCDAEMKKILEEFKQQ
ncbi:MAG: hypothetical protein JO089_04230, partial [Alphaproteobacteria bacterium]|nr:hypothetical protein [Alphaproteobacteria bacterium]